jgi:hypothetical protein
MSGNGAQDRRQQPPKVYKRLPKIYNRHFGDAPLSARYCGRGTKWGNPFVIGGWWPLKQRRMTRDDVCDRFENEILPKLDVSELKGVDLECNCVPLRCHCEPIIRKANPGYEEAIQAEKIRRAEKIARAQAAEEAAEEKDREWRKDYNKKRWEDRNKRRGQERREYREARADKGSGISNSGVRHGNDRTDQEPDGEAE